MAVREEINDVVAEWWSQVSATVVHGLQVTVVGMLLVFFTLGLIILSMVLLTKLPWLRFKKEHEETVSAPPATNEPLLVTDTVTKREVAAAREVVDDELAQVAAIAVAVLRAHQESPRVQGARTARPHIRATGSGWRIHGRASQIGL